jgi:hypothetical protein
MEMNSPRVLVARVGARPPGAASRPQLRVGRPGAGLAVAVGLAALGSSGCESADAAQISSPYVVAIAEDEAPSYSDAELTLYESQTPVAFPIRKPTGAELSALKGNVSPYPHAPYLLDSDETIEVNYTITNLDDQSHTVWLLIDPWNEFVRYRPGVTVVSADETVPNLSGIETPFVIGPKERIQGNIQPQDMSHLALKLDTAMKIMATTFTADSAYGAATLMNNDFNTQNVPGPNNPLLAMYTPTVVAGLTGFDLGLQSYEQMNVAIELTVNVLDQSGTGKVQAPGTTTGLIGPPPAFLRIPGSM